MSSSSQVDHVVIGAGSAGCAVAARLSEDADARVVVLEAGGPDTLEAIHQPPMWPTLWGTEVDWAYETTPQAANGGLVHQWPRGKVLGGSSSLNGMVYLRGNPADFDDWAYHGCKGWDYDALLPLFRRMEDAPDGDPHYRGRGGPNAPRPRSTRTRSAPRSSRPRGRRATRSPTTTTARSSRAPATTT
jgi:choline dehydrogenase